ncbi:MAG TPA: hypothetical protein PLC13_01815 [Bacillota bacterium]|nr:hypothetical protein [Bacillota bacterium]
MNGKKEKGSWGRQQRGRNRLLERKRKDEKQQIKRSPYAKRAAEILNRNLTYLTET